MKNICFLFYFGPPFFLVNRLQNVNKREKMETHDILLNHVVLHQENSRFVHVQALVLQLIENVENLSEWLPAKTVEIMDRLKRAIREHAHTVIAEIINELVSGDSFSMFIRRQNCAITFHIPATETDNTDVLNIIAATLHPPELFDNESEIKVTPVSF